MVDDRADAGDRHADFVVFSVTIWVLFLADNVDHVPNNRVDRTIRASARVVLCANAV
jgi:hypothetical protein